MIVSVTVTLISTGTVITVTSVVKVTIKLARTLFDILKKSS